MTAVTGFVDDDVDIDVRKNRQLVVEEGFHQPSELEGDHLKYFLPCPQLGIPIMFAQTHCSHQTLNHPPPSFQYLTYVHLSYHTTHIPQAPKTSAFHHHVS